MIAIDDFGLELGRQPRMHATGLVELGFGADSGSDSSSESGRSTGSEMEGAIAASSAGAELVEALRAHDGPVAAVTSIETDGMVVLFTSGYEDGAVKKWDLTGKLLYDLGAGTFDASVVRHTARGFETVALDGRADLGGLDIDAALIGHLAETYGTHADWRRLTDPATGHERRSLREFLEADQCAANDTDEILAHVSTANTARDMDFIREVLGEDKLSYFGASYGSSLGAAYASLFPEQSDRIIIDSNFGGAGVSYDSQRGYGLGVEDTFPTFAEWAAERDASYGLGATPEEVRENYFALAERLDETPVGDYGGKLFRFGIFAGMYGEGNFQATARAWQGLEAGDASAMQTLTNDQSADAPDSDAAEELSPVDNALSAYLAVSCNDSDWPEDVETYRQAVEADREQYPLFGAAGANISPCAFWHHEPTEPTLPINSDGPQNVLIMQNLYDNATPHAGAIANREAFGDRARLVEVDVLGHGVYVFGRTACALNIGTVYLVDGEMPEEDVFCETGDAQALDEEAQERRDNTLAELTW